MPGYPYLRVDRFLSSFSGDPMSAAAFDAWVAQLRRLDDEARAVEFANLPAADRLRLIDGVPALSGTEPLAATRRCAEELARADLADEASRARLRKAARVPPDYDDWKRVIGLYPLTRIAFASGIRRWQAETRAVFASEPPVLGRLVRYVPAVRDKAAPAEIAAIMSRGQANPLGVPDLRPEERERLFAAFAPELAIDEIDDNDRVGALAYGERGALGVDTARPASYRRVSYTRFRGRTLLQLNYSFWFPSRPLDGPSDLLGHL